MKPARNSRGFRIYADFTDYDGCRVYIVKSSLATRDCIRIYPEIKTHLGQPLAGAHLTKPQARRVISALQKFVDGK